MPDWFDRFKARIVKRCEQRNISLSDLLKSARVSHDFLAPGRQPKHGYRYDNLKKIAKLLGWTVDQLMGEAEIPAEAEQAFLDW